MGSNREKSNIAIAMKKIYKTVTNIAILEK
jgi:hypothetical protein